MTETMQNIRKLLKGLSREDLEQPNLEITESLEKYVGLPGFFHKCMEQRFSDGLLCPHCGKKHIVRFGKVKGRQRL